MKILIPNVVGKTDNSENRLRVKSASYQFSEVAQGRHVGLFPVKFRVQKQSGQDQLNAEKLVRVEVAGEASDNNRGARRVMLKVSLPYSRAVPDATGSSYLLDAANGGAISAHIVLSVPSRLRQDLLEQNDQVVSRVASSNVALVMRLLASLTGALGSTVSLADPTAAFNASNKFDELVKVDEGIGELNYVIDNTDQVFDTAPTSPAANISGGGGPRSRVQTYASETFGADGLSVHERLAEAPGLAAAARDPITRGLFGLVPIEENAQIVQRTAVIKSYLD